MSTTIPLHRRTRVWYGTRADEHPALPQAPRPAAGERVQLQGLTIPQLPAEIRQAPFDRRETSLL